MYSGYLNGINFGTSNYYQGNSFLSLTFNNKTIPPASITIENKPYGFIANPEPNTIFNVQSGIAIGCFDDRVPYNVAEIKSKPGSSQLFAKDCYTLWSPGEINMSTQLKDGDTYKIGFGMKIVPKSITIPIFPDGTIDHACLYSFAKHIFDNILSYMVTELVANWLATHTHSSSGSGPPNTPPPTMSYYSSQYPQDILNMKTERT